MVRKTFFIQLTIAQHAFLKIDNKIYRFDNIATARFMLRFLLFSNDLLRQLTFQSLQTNRKRCDNI